MDKIRKLPLGRYHSKYHCRKGPVVEDKRSGKCGMRTGHMYSLKISLHHKLFNCWKKNSNFTMDLAGAILTKGSKLALTVIRHIDTMYHLIRYTGKDTSLLWSSCQEKYDHRQIMRRHQTNSNSETFYKMWPLVFKDDKQRLGTITGWRRLRKYNN